MSRAFTGTFQQVPTEQLITRYVRAREKVVLHRTEGDVWMARVWADVMADYGIELTRRGNGDLTWVQLSLLTEESADSR